MVFSIRTRWLVGLLGVAFALVAMSASSGCSKGDSRPSGPLRVVVSIAPLAGIVEPLAESAGGSVRVLAPTGVSAHGFELTPDDLRAIAQADVLITIGLGFDRQVMQAAAAHRASWRRDVVLGTVLNVDQEDPDHEHNAFCDHGPIDPHIWLDPGLVSRSVTELAQVLAEVRPESADAITEAAQRQLAMVQEIDSAYQVALAPFDGAEVVTLHAAWGRLFERYGLSQVATVRPIESVEPTPVEIAEVADQIRERGIRVVFAEPQHSRAAADKVADAAGASVHVIDPVGTGDWAGLMRSNLDVLIAALSEG